ncbi:MAG TPA: hypothetical protein DCE42_07480 [Myxococcales bacterium]|nr:hypothetical protein [Myxococcales bacterium]
MDAQEQVSQPPVRKKRQIKNLLIDRSYQLRYMLWSVVLCVLIFGGLGTWLIWESRESSKFMKQQREAFIQAFRKERSASTKIVEKIKTSARKDLRKVLKVSRDMLNVQLKDKDPDVRSLAKSAQSEFEKDDKVRLQRMQKEDAALLTRRKKEDAALLSQIKHQAKKASMRRTKHEQRVLFFLVGFGLIAVVLISFFSILWTHKVAGPLFKMGRYFDRVSEGELATLQGLREGDQLQDFYARFQRMHQSLRAQQEYDVEVLEGLLSQDLSDTAKEQLAQLIEDKKDSLKSDDA